MTSQEAVATMQAKSTEFLAKVRRSEVERGDTFQRYRDRMKNLRNKWLRVGNPTSQKPGWIKYSKNKKFKSQNKAWMIVSAFSFIKRESRKIKS